WRRKRSFAPFRSMSTRWRAGSAPTAGRTRRTISRGVCSPV
ncbi:MAG: Putative polysaccharide deacetylase, partial [uncultured Rubrobacteraceae bacterium]